MFVYNNTHVCRLLGIKKCSCQAMQTPLVISLRILGAYGTLIKKENQIFLIQYIGKFRMEQLQSHIWQMATSHMGKYFRISSYIRKPFLIYDFATAPLWISLHMRKIWFSFLSVQSAYTRYERYIYFEVRLHPQTLLAKISKTSTCHTERIKYRRNLS